jgi:tRNA pseudouridine38-40 synthase
LPRYKLTLEYNGQPYHGWQRQQEYPSIQQELEEAIERFTGQFCEIFCAGRTDAGVHATGQVAHVDLSRDYKPFAVQQGINFHLATRNISVIHADPVADNFHARFSAVRREYLYRICNRTAWLALEMGRVWQVPEKLDVDAMHKAAQLLLGTHDFTSFRDTHCQSQSPVKTLERFDVLTAGTEIHCYLSARSFLHHQVRNMVGTLRLIGNGKWREQDLLAALAARSRRAAGETAPPDGLYLTAVGY